MTTARRVGETACVAPIDEKLYDQLVAYFAAKGSVREDFGAGMLILSELEGRPLDPPMRLHVTPEGLNRHLQATAPDAAGSFPEIAALEAAWRVFTQHVSEAVGSARPGETEVVVDGTDVVARTPE